MEKYKQEVGYGRGGAEMAHAWVYSSSSSVSIISRTLPRGGGLNLSNTKPQRFHLHVKAVSAPEDCNEEECAPAKEVGRVSMEWVAEEKTKVSGTFPPLSRKQGRAWTGYVEKDTAGQTNIYSVEPTIYVAESGISSGVREDSSADSQNSLAVSFGLALILVAGASSILLQVGKNSQEIEYSGPALSYYIQKFSPATVTEVTAQIAPELTSSPTSSEAPVTVESMPSLEIPAESEPQETTSIVPDAAVESEISSTEEQAMPSSEIPVESEPQETTSVVPDAAVASEISSTEEQAISP